MSKIGKEEIINNAWALKVSLTDQEIDYCVEEVNKFFDSRPELNCELVDDDCMTLSPLRYVHEDIVNVFSAREETLASTEDVLVNASDREGNYIKIPKVLK